MMGGGGGGDGWGSVSEAARQNGRCRKAQCEPS